MGYTTTFEGRFELDKPLKPEHLAYLKAFSGKRHMKWRVEEIAKLPDPVREAAGLPLGNDGEHFVGVVPAHDPYIVDYNEHTPGQPGLWCQWIPSDDGKYIAWNGMEKFYSYVEWVVYLIYEFLEPWGYVLNGEVSFQGEEEGDKGVIVVKDNDIIDDLWYAFHNNIN